MYSIICLSRADIFFVNGEILPLPHAAVEISLLKRAPVIFTEARNVGRVNEIRAKNVLKKKKMQVLIYTARAQHALTTRELEKGKAEAD